MLFCTDYTSNTTLPSQFKDYITEENNKNSKHSQFIYSFK